MSKTLQDLRNQFYWILKEEEDTSAYSLSMADVLLNSAQLRICSGSLVNPLNSNHIIKGKLPFLQGNKLYTLTPYTYTSTTLSVWWTTIDTDTTNYPNTGAIYISGDIVTYTGKTLTQLTGCSGITFAHISGSKIYTLYALPSDCMNLINVSYNSIQLTQLSYDEIFKWDRHLNWNYWIPLNNYVYNDNMVNINNEYMILNWQYILYIGYSGIPSTPLLIRYEKKSTTMLVWTDITTIPDEWAISTIPYIAVWEMLFNRGEEWRAAELLNFWYGQVREMYTYYNNQSSQDMNNMRIWMWYSKIQ
jgi:hypothetical protein